MRLLKKLSLLILGMSMVHRCGGSFQGTQPTGQDDTWEYLIFKHLITDHLDGCQIILIGNSKESAMKNKIEFMSDRTLPYLLLDPEEKEPIASGMYRTLFSTVAFTFPPPNCIAIISDVTTNSLLESTVSFLDEMDFHEWPYIKVAFFGTSKEAKNSILNNYVLRNAISMVFLSPKEATNQVEEDGPLPSSVIVDGRCFFCKDGEQNEVMLDELSRTNQYKTSVKIFQDMPRDFNGHQFKIVALAWYPITSLTPLSTDPCPITAPGDSVDIRMLTEISKILNFRYVARFPCDNQWGTDDGNGNWSGTVGTLARHEADFSLLLSLYHSRTLIIEYSRPYLLEPVTFVARKPQPLPRSTALLRPFGTEIWVILAISVFLAALVFWVVEKFSSRVEKNRRRTTLADSFFFTFSIILKEPRHNRPAFYESVRIFIGCWWLYSFIVGISYSSALVAHLTFPSRAVAVHYASELVESGNKWTWGYEPIYDSGWTWFKDTENEHYQAIFKNFEAEEAGKSAGTAFETGTVPVKAENMLLTKDRQMAKVVKGKHAFFTYTYYIRSIIESEYTDSHGYTPIYIAKEKYLNYGGYGWAFRKGAPFRLQIDKHIHHIIEAGLIDLWLKELISIRAREVRKERELQNEKEGKSSVYAKESSALVVLGLDHMQGAFYLYAVGVGLGFLILLMEVLLENVVEKLCGGGGSDTK